MLNNLNVSVIIVNYNGKKWLEKLFNSLIDQTFKNFEVIFVDNNSFDDSVFFLEQNYKDKLNLKVVKSERNLGFAGGNNLGIQNALGEYVLFLNNDTWLDLDFLEKIYIFYKQNNFDVIGPLENDYEDKKRREYNIKIDFVGHPIYRFKKPKEEYFSVESFYLSGVCLFFKKSLYLETLGLDNDFFMYFEEIDWFWRLQLLNKKISHINGLFVHHAIGGSTGTGIKYNSFLWRNQNTLQMLLKNYKYLNLFWILPIYFVENLLEILFFILILKPKIAFSYIQGWIFNIKNIKKTLSKRAWIQENRVIGDLQIFKKMYLGIAKFYHLITFILKNAKKSL